MAIRILRQILIEGDIAFVPLTQGKFAIIDAVDVPLVEQWNWHADESHSTWYARTMTGRDGRKKISKRMHTIILPDVPEVDHRDGNGLNCRRYNLRPAERYQNLTNRPKQVNNTSGFKGISWSKSAKRWWVQLTVNRQHHSIGYFKSIDDARSAYEQAIARLCGGFDDRALLP